MRISRILVPLDGTFAAERALELASSLCRIHSAQLFLLSVHHDQKQAEQTEAYILDRVQRIQGDDLKVMGLACQGDPAQVILREIQAQNVDLVILSRKNKYGLSGWYGSSVSEAIIRHASCPTLVMRADSEPPLVRRSGPLLVLLDGSTFAEAALGHAAMYDGLEILLMRVVEPGTATTAAAEYLRIRAHQLGLGGLKTRTLVHQGVPLQEILQVAEREKVSMIFLTSKGEGFSASLGRLAKDLCRTALCPTLLVKAGMAPRAPERILLPVDGSSRGEKAVAAALTLPGPHIKQATLLMVGDLPVAPPPYLQEACRDHLRGLQATLERQAERLKKEGWDVTCQLLEGDPVHTVLEQARPEKYDLVLLATHARAGLARWVMGSVSESIARQCALPVLIVNSSTVFPSADP